VVPASNPAVVVMTAARPAANRLVGFIAVPLPSVKKCLHWKARAGERIGSEQA
jgi:hypothetical protein